MRKLSAFALALLALTLGTAPLGAQTSLDRVLISGLEDGYGLAQQFEQLGLDVVEGSVKATSMELVVSPWSMEYLVSEGYSPVVIQIGKPLKELQQEYFDAHPEAVPVGYPSPAQITSILNNLAAANPSIAAVHNLTTDYGAPQTHEGRDLIALKISDNVAQDEDEIAFLLVAAQHCREINTHVASLTAAQTLLGDYGNDPATTAIVDNTEIFIVVNSNPDGYDYVYNVNNNWRKNRRFNGGTCFGVDLNRNFDAGWSAACSGSTNGCTDTYKGPSVGSEPENQALMILSDAERFGKVLDLHSFGQETLWAYSCNTHPWELFMQATAIVLSQASGYGNANRPPSAEGEHYEWQFQRGAFAHLQEIGTSFQPTFASAQAEAADVYGAVFSMLETPIHLTGHVTDACNGAPIAATIQFQGVSFPFPSVVTADTLYGRFDVHPPAGNYTLVCSAAGYATQNVPVTVTNGSTTTVDVELVSTGPVAVNYCTPGTSAAGCQATLSASGTPSASAPTGFVVSASSVEGSKDGLFFFGTNGQQANSWGNGTSLQCVVPPVVRAPLMTGTGTIGQCDGVLLLDLNALWCPTCPKPSKNPGFGATVDLQLWYRDPGSTSNQSTSLSDALEFTICE